MWQAVRRLSRWQRPVRATARRVEYGPPGDGEYYSFGGDDGDTFSERARAFASRHRGALVRGALVAAAGTAYYRGHVERAPVTGRRRFMALSAATEQRLADAALRETLEGMAGRVRPAAEAGTAGRVIAAVVARLSAAAEGDAALRPFVPPRGFRAWLVDAPETPNAMVLPTGDIFVMSGLLPVAAGAAGLAAVLGHEMAHALARHAGEQLSARQFWAVLFWAVRALVLPDAALPGATPEALLRDLLLRLPYSRRCEAEADHIGLHLMARACYAPDAAVGLWERMAAVGGGSRVPEFLSTHPSHGSRVARISALLPAARRVYEEAGCLEAKHVLDLFRSP